MAQHISLFEYTDYRQLLRDAIKSRGLTYRSFSDKFGDVASYSTIASTLNAKYGDRPPRTLSFEALCSIAKSLRFSDEEVKFLVLLKLENDAEVRDGSHGTAFSNAASTLLLEYRDKSNSRGADLANSASMSPFVSACASLIELLPIRFKARIADKILVESRVEISRHHRRPGIKNVIDAAKRLERLIRIE
jgi:transcriptional regulator with XRE-family HTH domain